MVHDFQPGDFMIYQLESGYGLLRVLDVQHINGDDVWHIAAYRDLFPDPESVDAAIERPDDLSVEMPHVALTNRAFESTPVAKMRNVSLTEEDVRSYIDWKDSGGDEVFDRSIRLILGYR